MKFLSLLIIFLAFQISAQELPMIQVFYGMGTEIIDENHLQLNKQLNKEVNLFIESGQYTYELDEEELKIIDQLLQDEENRFGLTESTIQKIKTDKNLTLNWGKILNSPNKDEPIDGYVVMDGMNYTFRIRTNLYNITKAYSEDEYVHPNDLKFYLLVDYIYKNHRQFERKNKNNLADFLNKERKMKGILYVLSHF